MDFPNEKSEGKGVCGQNPGGRLPGAQSRMEKSGEAIWRDRQSLIR